MWKGHRIMFFREQWRGAKVLMPWHGPVTEVKWVFAQGNSLIVPLVSVSNVSTILWVIKVCICQWELCYHHSKLCFQLNAILWTNGNFGIMSVVLAFADRVMPMGSSCWVSVLVTFGNNMLVCLCMYVCILTLFLKNREKLRLYLWWRDATAHFSFSSSHLWGMSAKMWMLLLRFMERL